MIFWLFTGAVSLLVFTLILRPWCQKGAVSIWVLLIATMTLLPLTLYRHWGASQQLVQAKELQQQMAQTKKQLLALGTRDKVIAELEKRVAENPKKAKGWYLLAKLYSGSGDHAKSLDAINKAVKLEPKNPQYQLELVEVNFINHKKLRSSDKTVLTEVLEKAPGNINALNLFALDAYQQKHYKLAISYWQRVLTQIPADSDDAEHIRKMIDQASN